MPKYSREMEDKIIACFEQGKKNSVIARELNIYRGALPSRRTKWEKGKQEQEKTETEPEKIVQQNHPDSHPLDPQIYTLIRYQGTHSQEEALSQAIETQHGFNPYILNHGLKTPKELMKLFEDKIQLGLDNFKDLQLESNISRRLIDETQKVINKLYRTVDEKKKSDEERYEEGYQDGKKVHAIFIPCTICGEPCTIVPGTDIHRLIIELLKDIAHVDCRPKYERIYGT